MTRTDKGRADAPRGRPFRWILAAFLLFWMLGDVFAPYGPVALERGPSGDFEETEGGHGAPLYVGLQYASATTNQTASTSTIDEDRTPGQPRRVSSLTIVDLSGTRLTGRVAHALVDRAKAVPSLERIDVRTPSQPMLDTPLGDQILLLEEFESDRGALAGALPIGRAKGVIQAYFGHVPQVSWVVDWGTAQRVNGDWTVDASVFHVGSPLARTRTVANYIADAMTLPALFEELNGDGPELPAFPAELVADSIDLGTSDEILAAFAIDGPPVFTGVRHQRKGEALWRYAGADATERLESALAALRAAGWESSGRGLDDDGRPRVRMLRRGDEHVWFQDEDSRRQWHQLPRNRQFDPLDPSAGPEPLEPAVHVHYRHEPNEDELRALVARSEELGVRDALIANLPQEHLVTLGLAERTVDGKPVGATEPDGD